jgi:hypothetical protein
MQSLVIWQVHPALGALPQKSPRKEWNKPKRKSVLFRGREISFKGRYLVWPLFVFLHTKNRMNENSSLDLPLRATAKTVRASMQES